MIRNGRNFPSFQVVLACVVVTASLTAQGTPCSVSISPAYPQYSINQQTLPSIFGGGSIQVSFGASSSAGVSQSMNSWGISFPSNSGLTATVQSPSGSGMTAIIVASQTISGTFSGIVSWSGYCGGPSISGYHTSATTGITVTVIPGVQPGTITTSTTTGIAPTTVTIGYSGVIGPPILSGTWYLGDGTTAPLTASSITMVYSIPSSYPIFLRLDYLSNGYIHQYLMYGPTITVGAPPLTVSSTEPPFAEVGQPSVVDIIGTGFLQQIPTVSIGGQAATNVSVMSQNRIRCTVPPASTSGSRSVGVSFTWGSASGATALLDVPEITSVTPSVIPPTPTTISVACSGTTPTSTLLVNGVSVASTVTTSGLQATLTPSDWQALGAAVLQVTTSGPTGPVSRPFVVPASSALNSGTVAAFPIAPSTGSKAWLETIDVPPSTPVTLVLDFLPPPAIQAWPSGQFLLAVGSPNVLALVDGVGVFGVPDPAGVTSPLGTLGMSVTVPVIAVGTVVHVQAIYADALSTLGFTLTWPLVVVL